jgi:hypothetical protein
MIEFSCEGCGKSFEVDDSLAGRRSRCKQCGAVTRIPASEPVLEVLAPLPLPVPEAAPKRKRKKKARKPGTIDRDAWISLGVGSGLAVLALAVPLIGFVIHVLMTVIHELGHTATAWLFASPAMPSFDLSYGGGVSLILARQPILVVAAYGVFAYLLFRARGDRPELLKWSIAAGLYTLVMFSPLRGLLITAMGHGSELLFAGIFLHRALSGNQILRGEERPLYAFLGLFILLYDSRFAFDLMSSRAHRVAYGDAKGGGHWMDFEVIANETLHWPLQSVAAVFLFACVLTPVAALLVHRYGRPWK